MVLVTPERLANAEHLEPLKRSGVSLFVVDEAHCVSHWGHDFLPAYLELKQAVAALGRPPVLAVTATAPPERTRDILQSLGIPDARVVRTGIERDNLFFEVHATVNRSEKESQLLSLLRSEPGQVIVYAATRGGAPLPRGSRRGSPWYRFAEASGGRIGAQPTSGRCFGFLARDHGRARSLWRPCEAARRLHG